METNNSLGREVYYPSLEYKMGWKTKLGAIALGVVLGFTIVGTVMAVICSLV